jgi:hypothetical protein
VTHYPETLGAPKESADRPDSADQDSPRSDVSLPQHRHVFDVTAAPAEGAATEGTDTGATDPTAAAIGTELETGTDTSSPWATDAEPVAAGSGGPVPPLPADLPPRGPRKPRRGGRIRRFFRSPITRVVLLVLAVVVGWLGYSISGALTRPGKDSVSARLAEWGRDHHMNSLVNRLEKIQYDHNKPKVGGTVKTIPKAAGDTPSPLPSAVVPSLPPHTAAPPPVKTPAGLTPKPGEGQWQSVVFSGELPAVRLTYVRPDDQHTSYLAALMWLDPKVLKATLHPGIQDPGGHWQVPSSITPEEQATIAAAFPAGFRLTGATGSRGGWYSEGRTVTSLRDGAASFVIYKDGSVKIGQWGRDVTAAPNVASVRQNLDLLIDNGQLDPSCADNNSPKWGWTLGNKAYVPRTAIGQRADGSLVFVNSPATSVCSIGHLLQAAGVVRGMELDINPEWSIGFYYTHENGQIVGNQTRLDQGKGGDWYFSTQSRDFLSFSLR